MEHGIFITYRGYLEQPLGGVQICTQEYIDVIKTAGIELKLCTFNGDRRLSTRVLRRLNSSAYFRPVEVELLHAVRRLAVETQPQFIFLNQGDIAPIARNLRGFIPSSCQMVLLSHGLGSTDLLHFIRLRERLPLRGRVRPIPTVALGDALITENAVRAHVDVVCAVSPFDVELEHWLGAKRVGWLPRIVKSSPLIWRPQGNRLGYIGTLDHAPNLEGLIAVLERLGSRDVAAHMRLRVVGRPHQTGHWLSERYPFIDYLGALDDAALAEEAATWNAVIHPLFCHARGCSTKLAVAVGWHIPVVTTTMGHRGYEWREGGLVVANDPNEFADECLRLLNFDAAVGERQRVINMARSSPTTEENALRFRALLKLRPADEGSQ